MITKLATNPRLRSLLRRSGFLSLIKKLSGGRESVYEKRFSDALLGCIRQGDVVWDVGANVGFYTVKLGAAVGTDGIVVAFEPVSTSYRRMMEAVSAANLTNVVARNCALGHCEDSVSILVTTELNGVTNTLVKRGIAERGRNEVISVARGDALIAKGLPGPSVIKIDVEAFEEEVMFGLREWLSGGGCREVFCEVHFAQLAARGSMGAPDRIVSLLLDSGFRVRWLDASHIQATGCDV